MEFGVPEFGAYMVRIAMSSWLIPLDQDEVSLSLLIKYTLKSIWSNIMITIPVCFLFPYPWNLFFMVLVLKGKMRFLTEKRIFLIH